MSREKRPEDSSYYRAPGGGLLQGDIFRDIPLAYPLPADELILEGEPFEASGTRRFLSGPLEFGFAMLLTPACSMTAQGVGDDELYAHPVRTIAPIQPLEDLVNTEAIKSTTVDDIRKLDHAANYMYLPANNKLGIPESMALLYMPATMHHDIIIDQRIAQLQHEGAQQLHRKLVMYYTSWVAPRSQFEPTT